MKKKKFSEGGFKILIIVLTLFFYSTTKAQPGNYVSNNYQKYTVNSRKDFPNEKHCSISNNNVLFNFNNYGLLLEPTTFDGIRVLYKGGIILSGYSNGELWTNSTSPIVNRNNDYIPGSVGDEGIGKIYCVSSSDTVFGQSWQNWKEAVNKGADFYDGDGDGIYIPVDLNGNNIWDKNEDAPGLKGDYTAFLVYNDAAPEDERIFRDVEPQGIEIRQTVWTNKSDPNLKNVFFIRYSIYNTGSVAETFDSVYFSIWNDSDIGEYTDDLLGSSPELLTGYTYDSGNDPEFGNNAPAAMETYLSIIKSPNNDLPPLEQLDFSFINYYPYCCCIVENEHWTKETIRNILLGLDYWGDPFYPPGPEGGVFNMDIDSINNKWMFSGDPIDSIGWLNTLPCDKNSYFNVGPFTINAGESIDVTVAFHYSRGETNLESVRLGLEKARYLRENAESFDTQGELKGNIPENFILYQNYPNPFNPNTTIKYSIPNIETANVNVKLTVYDILGREIKTLVNANQGVGKYSVQFNATTASGGLPSGVYFYTLRAGNFVQTKKMILVK